MLGRQTTGSVVCVSCGRLVGVQDERCHHCGRRNPGLWGWAPALRRLGDDLGFWPIVLGSTVLLYLLALALDPSEMLGGGLLGLFSPSGCSLFLLGSSGGFPVFQWDRWWTVLSANWLHGSLLHIAFNLYWIRQLAPGVAQVYGPGRSVILFVVSGVLGFLTTSFVWLIMPTGILRGAYLTVGASAAVFGWIGALLYYGRRSGSSEVTRQLLGFAVPLFVLGLLIPTIDNWAHVGGFAGGYLLGRILDPLKPERIDHVVVALVCLLLSALSIVVSVLHALPRAQALGCDF